MVESKEKMIPDHTPRIPPRFTRYSTQRSRLWGIILLLAIASITVLLGVRALQENIIFFYAPAELQAMTEKPTTEFRLGGLVRTGSYRGESIDKTRRHFFTLEDGQGQIDVVFEGILPDLFREGQGIIGLGVWQGDHFRANALLAKHDENYMPREVAEALKDTGVWQDKP